MGAFGRQITSESQALVACASCQWGVTAGLSSYHNQVSLDGLEIHTSGNFARGVVRVLSNLEPPTYLNPESAIFLIVD